MKLLVSVRDEHEALLAAGAGADLIDMKEPLEGALGALPIETIERIVASMRRRHPELRLSATVGDPTDDATTLERVRRVAACGVDDVKVGIGPHDASLLDALAAQAAKGLSIVPVLIADDGVEPALLARACAGPFAAVMLDTFDKSRGSLVAQRPEAELRGFVDAMRAHRKLAGLAGSLRLDDVPALRRLAPDFAGFRGAVCTATRTAALDAECVRALRAAADRPLHPAFA